MKFSVRKFVHRVIIIVINLNYLLNSFYNVFIEQRWVFIMFCPEFKDENLTQLLDGLIGEGWLEPSRASSDEAKKTANRAAQTCLDFYFQTVEKGYQRVLEEAKNPWTEIKAQEVILPVTSLARLKNPLEFAKIKEKYSSLQAYFNYSDELIQNIFLMATKLGERCEWDDAIAMMIFLLYLNPYIPECWQFLGVCWEQTSQWGAAQVAHEMAIQQGPLNPEFYRSACIFLLEQKNYDRAEEILNEGLITLNKQAASPAIAEAKELLTAALVYVESVQNIRGS